MKFVIKDKNKYVEKIEIAEVLLKELKDIFAWDLSGEIELEIETAKEKVTADEKEIESICNIETY